MKPTRRGVSKKGKTISRCYGWAPDLPDHPGQRDYRYSALPRPVLRLPWAVDLRPVCSKVEDQGTLGSCAANTLADA